MKESLKKSLLYILLGLPLIPIASMMATAPWTDKVYRQLIHVSGETALFAPAVSSVPYIFYRTS